MPYRTSPAAAPSSRRPASHRSSRRPAASNPLRAVVEAVESRQLLSVSLDSGGWTVVTPGAADRVVYVSSSQGNDANTGLSSAAPVRTLAKATSLMRDGYGDEMLLKRGDTWHETFGTWRKSGKSADDPMVIGAYGTGNRPTLATGNAVALSTGLTSVPTINHLYVMGIKFYADARDPHSPTYAGTGAGGQYGLRFTAGGTDLLVEDCAVQDYANNVAFYRTFGPLSNVRVRRSLIADAYNPAGNSEGFFAYQVDGLTLEGNVLDHNGWNSAAGVNATQYNHDAYVKENVTGFVARGNVFSNAAAHGLQARGGGTIDGNVFLNDPIGLSFGLVNGSPMTPGGVSGRVTNNVFLGGGTIAGVGRGWGLQLGNIRAGAGVTVSRNVFAHGAGGTGGYAISLEPGTGVTNVSQAVGLNDVTIQNNTIYDWARGIRIDDALTPGGTGQNALNNLLVGNNDVQQLQTRFVLWPGAHFNVGEESFSGNRYSSAAGSPMVSNAPPAATVVWTAWAPNRETGGQATQVTYHDPTVTAGSYAASAGYGSGDAGFVSAARANSSQDWDDGATAAGLAAYIRGGFSTASTPTVRWVPPAT